MGIEEEELKVEFFDCVCIHSTEKAILVKLPEMDKPLWFPQSQIDADSEVWKQGDEGTLVVSRWIAKQKGLI